MKYEGKDCLDAHAKPTKAGLHAIIRLRDALNAVIYGHDDNTLARCRVSLDGHDCCYTCNLVEVALCATLQEMADQDS